MLKAELAPFFGVGYINNIKNHANECPRAPVKNPIKENFYGKRKKK